MNKYEHGKIYKLVNNNDSEIYVGSTHYPLSIRFNLHKSHAKGKNKNNKVYNHLNHVGFDNVRIELIEEYPCESKRELEQRERYWIETLKPNLNKNMPSRTQEEIKEIKRNLSTLYNAWHRERINNRMKELYWLRKNKAKEVATT
jgi:group I intron endonuclease